MTRTVEEMLVESGDPQYASVEPTVYREGLDDVLLEDVDPDLPEKWRGLTYGAWMHEWAVTGVTLIVHMLKRAGMAAVMAEVERRWAECGLDREQATLGDVTTYEERFALYEAGISGRPAVP